VIAGAAGGSADRTRAQSPHGDRRSHDVRGGGPAVPKRIAALMRNGKTM
jgi:hypothetical protein